MEISRRPMGFLRFSVLGMTMTSISKQGNRAQVYR